MHKDLTNPPGRPIISGINSCTCQLSHYIDIYLQDLVRSQESYLKDSDDLIRTLKEIWYEEDYSFITMDVTSLYSNIQPDIEIRCVEEILKGNSEFLEKQRNFFLEALHLIIHNNFWAVTEKFTIRISALPWARGWHHPMPIYLWGNLNIYSSPPTMLLDPDSSILQVHR